MCLLAIEVECVPGAPLVMAANREEYFERPSAPPQIRGTNPRMLCGADLRAGGTWLGVNEYGVVVAVTNRWGLPIPTGTGARSRGSLCLDLLGHRSASDAAQRARMELAGGQYAGANYLCADRVSAFFVSNADLVVQTLEPGTHLLSNGPLDDPADPRLQVARKLLCPGPMGELPDAMRRARRVCGYVGAGPGDVGIIVRFADRGTVSSTLIALTADSAQAEYWHADGPPDQVPYTDYSPAMRELLAGQGTKTDARFTDRQA